MRTMYDAVTPSNIPADAQMVAGYVDGRYAWTAADWARFPHAVKVRIAVFPTTDDGHVLDCENGDATPNQCPGWVKMRRAAGADPTIYMSLAIRNAVVAAFQSQGVAQPSYGYWIAAYPGNGANLYPGDVAHQYADPGPVDISVVADFWPGVDVVPVPVPHPAPHPLVHAPDGNPFTILAEDGAFGPQTTKATQWKIKTLADGQWGLASIVALQKHLGVTADAVAGPVTIKALQAKIGCAQDGSWGPLTTRYLQGALNRGNF